MASFIVLLTFGTTDAWHKSTVVSPSIPVSIEAGPGSFGSLFLYSSGWLALVPNGFPPLTVLMVTGCPPTVAQSALSVVPFTKNPKTSLNPEPTYSLYSSDANTYWNETLEAFATKLNERMAASCEDCPLGRRPFRSAS